MTGPDYEEIGLEESQDPHSRFLSRFRIAALAKVNNAAYSRFHVKVCIVAGIGFFTDAYDIFAINIASIMLGYVYAGLNTPFQNSLPPHLDIGLKIATPCGRKRMYGFELIIIIVGTFGQAVSANYQAINIISLLIVWRFIMGIGIGGDYPLSAIISSEFASKHIRGRMMTSVFACQGWGQLTAAIVSTILVAIFRNSIESYTIKDCVISGLEMKNCRVDPVDVLWRLLIGLGGVPAAIALYFRLTIPETPRFVMDIERNVKQAARDADIFLNSRTTGVFWVDPEAVVQRVEAPRHTRRDFLNYFSKWKNGMILLGTAWSWFALDTAFYGLGLNNSQLLSANSTISGTCTTSISVIQTLGLNFVDNAGTVPEQSYNQLMEISVGNIILSLAGLIPGYWVAFLFIDSWGRKPIQLLGFTMLSIIFCCMGFGYDKMRCSQGGRIAFVVLFCLGNFFQNFGPNTTTFILPGEAFPTRYRSTAHGISAAAGKLGAILSQVAFDLVTRPKNATDGNTLSQGSNIGHIFEFYAFFMLTGIASTLLIPETKGRTLEDISNEDQDDFVKGIAGDSDDTLYPQSAGTTEIEMTP
ncbi:phosphate transporter [Sistotremastrum suecicum HHB10207 ss-3]|uniref:Phosphate transporter n=1 Tax=Sistotremastrum suecicum HHB10207 ss-3 TaxID=1314776 RepID=A0A165ZD97_9AGAM|nr:phosphate transporter [Sistotremastrum suecicum HHB10207 ss-3]